MKPHKALVVASFAALLAACAVGPDYRLPKTTAPSAFGEAAPDAPAAAPVGAWWTTFGDPTLDSLVARAARANPDLRRAQARVREARALRGGVAANLYPTVNATGGASRSRTSDNFADVPGITSNFFQAGFDAAWELDVFGGVRRGVEAADADVAASVEDRRDVLVSLLAEVARNYMELRGAQRESVIAHANLAAQQETLKLTHTRLDAGMASDLDVARAEAQTQTTASSIPVFDTAARQAIHALSVLVGEAPNALVAELSPDGAIPASLPEVPVGLPSDLLRRRPDVRRAERQLAAATARIGEAEADWFPHFSLTGALGLASDRLSRFFDEGSRTGSMGAGVSWPILDFGRIQSNVDVQRAREEQAADAYELAVLASLRDVEDSLVALANERARRVTLVAAETASRRAADLANQLWVGGRSDFLSVLDAQRDLFAIQDALVQSERRVASDVVALYKALGGGWDVDLVVGDAPKRGEAGRREFDLNPADKRP